MNTKPEINLANINDFIDYNKKTIAQFKEAILLIKWERNKHIKNHNFVKAYKLIKLELKFQTLLNKKIKEIKKEEIKTAKKKQ